MKYIHIETLHIDYNKVYACFGVENLKNTSLKIFKGGGELAPGAPALDPPLWFYVDYL